MMLAMMLLSLSAQDSRVPLSGGLPQSPAYRATTELTCQGAGKYVFIVENRGFRLSRITSTLNGVPVELRSTIGTLQGSTERLRDVMIEPIGCGVGSGAEVRVWGTDRVSTSSTFGERATLSFQAVIDSENRRAISERHMGCRPEDQR
jgi:hypothetical protein